MLRQADFTGRLNLADYLNRTGRTGEAAEVGTHRGEFAAAFLAWWQGKRLYCVDPWRPMPGYEDQARLLPGGGADRDADYAACRERLARFGGRAVLLRYASAEAAPMFAPESLDCVYLDGDHRPEQVAADLGAWWPVVRPGGVLAGHDFLSRAPYLAFEGVQPAVLDFAGRHGLDVLVVPEADPEFQPWSFLLEKPT